jgi:hypothetical protein
MTILINNGFEVFCNFFCCYISWNLDAFWAHVNCAKFELFYKLLPCNGPPFPILGSFAYEGVTNPNGLKLTFKPKSSFILFLKTQGGGGGKKGTSCQLGFIIFSRELQITKLT